MDVSVIINATQATYFLPDEIGEISCRICAGKEGPRVVVTAYQCKVLSETEKTILLGLRDFLIATLEKAKYNVKRTPCDPS